MCRAMQPTDTGLASALARLESRWGSAAIRLGNGDRLGSVVRPGSIDGRGPLAAHAAGPSEGPRPLTVGALALVPAPEPLRAPARHDPSSPLADDVVSTGFPALDAVLGPGGLPREASATIRGDVSSGKTTLALRCIAEAQAHGAIAAYLDLGRSLDPLEAVSRGVDLRWLICLRPSDPAEGFAMAGSLLVGRTIDLLVVDLPARLPGRQEEALRRLAAHARRVGARLIVLEPQRLPEALHGALAEATSLRLELDRRGWIRLGRDVVGQQTEVTVAKNRFGPPGRRVELEIHYADAGERSTGTHRFAEATQERSTRTHGPSRAARSRFAHPDTVRSAPRPAIRAGTVVAQRLAHR